MTLQVTSHERGGVSTGFPDVVKASGLTFGCSGVQTADLKVTGV